MRRQRRLLHAPVKHDAACDIGAGLEVLAVGRALVVGNRIVADDVEPRVWELAKYVWGRCEQDIYALAAFEPPDGYPLAAPIPPGASEWVRRHVRYLTAVRYLDSLVGRVLDDLERRKLLERTVIIVTSDHGMEFDENGLGFRGHGTAYSELQLHTPLLVRWPGRSAGRVTRRTSHNDVAPTLLTGVFGCTNPPSDYASGHSLFSDSQWSWLIGASHLDFALIEPEQVTIIRQNGYEIRDQGYRLLQNPKVPQESLSAALHEMRRFYR